MGERQPRRSVNPTMVVVIASVSIVTVMVGLGSLVEDRSPRLPAGDADSGSSLSVDDVSASLSEQVPLLTLLRHPVVVAFDDDFLTWGPLRQGAAGAVFPPSSTSWRLVSPSPLPATTGHSGIWTGEEVILAGGIPVPGRASGTEVAAYLPGENRWRMLDPLPQPRRNAMGFFIGGRAVLAGGSSPQGQFSSTVLVARGDEGWGEVDVSHLVVAAAAIPDDRLIVVGFGTEAADRDVLHASVIDPVAMTVTSLPDLVATVDGMAFSVGVAASQDSIWAGVLGDGSLELHALAAGARSWDLAVANAESSDRVFGRNRFGSGAPGELVVDEGSLVSITPHDVFRLETSSATVIETAPVFRGCEEATTLAVSDSGSQVLLWADPLLPVRPPRLPGQSG